MAEWNNVAAPNFSGSGDSMNAATRSFSNVGDIAKEYIQSLRQKELDDRARLAYQRQEQGRGVLMQYNKDIADNFNAAQAALQDPNNPQNLNNQLAPIQAKIAELTMQQQSQAQQPQVAVAPQSAVAKMNPKDVHLTYKVGVQGPDTTTVVPAQRDSKSTFQPIGWTAISKTNPEGNLTTSDKSDPKNPKTILHPLDAAAAIIQGETKGLYNYIGDKFSGNTKDVDVSNYKNKLLADPKYSTNVVNPGSSAVTHRLNEKGVAELDKFIGSFNPTTVTKPGEITKQDRDITLDKVDSRKNVYTAEGKPYTANDAKAGKPRYYTVNNGANIIAADDVDKADKLMASNTPKAATTSTTPNYGTPKQVASGQASATLPAGATQTKSGSIKVGGQVAVSSNKSIQENILNLHNMMMDLVKKSYNNPYNEAQTKAFMAAAKNAAEQGLTLQDAGLQEGFDKMVSGNSQQEIDKAKALTNIMSDMGKMQTDQFNKDRDFSLKKTEVGIAAGRLALEKSANDMKLAEFGANYGTTPEEMKAIAQNKIRVANEEHEAKTLKNNIDAFHSFEEGIMKKAENMTKASRFFRYSVEDYYKEHPEDLAKRDALLGKISGKIKPKVQ